MREPVVQQPVADMGDADDEAAAPGREER